MGAWGTGIFENDEACDFADEIIEGASLSRLQEALDEVLQAGEYLDAPVATEGLAAADIVARLGGSIGQADAYTKKIDQWAKRVGLNPDEELANKAKAVVDRVRTEPSELLELWSDGDHLDEWLATLDALKQRLAVANLQKKKSDGLLSKSRLAIASLLKKR